MSKNLLLHDMPEIILASTSPQRAQILEELGISFSLVQIDVDEIVGSTPEETVLTNTKLKVAAALRSGALSEGKIVMAADTVLAMDGKIFGKPDNPEAAKNYLAAFSGRQICAFTVVAAIRKGDNKGDIAIDKALIRFFPLSEEMIDWYVATGEPLTRAGAFGISRIGEIFVDTLAGSYSCVAGLSKKAVLAVIAKISGNDNFKKNLLQLHNTLNLDSFTLQDGRGGQS